MKERIQKRNNPFGKDEKEFARILADKEQIEPLLYASCDMVIDTEQPLEKTVCEIRTLLEKQSLTQIKTE